LDRLHAVRRRWFIAVLLQICARILACTAFIAGTAALADRWTRPEGGPLLLLATAAAVSVLALAIVVVWPHRHRPGDRQVARFIEERCPEMDDTLATAVDLSRAESARGFAPLVIQSATARLHTLDLACLFDPADTRHAIGRLGLAGGALVLAMLFAFPFASRVLEEARLRYLPSSVTLTVEPGDLRIPIGRPLNITARLADRRGALEHATPTLTLDVNGQQRSVPMERTDRGFSVRINAVDRSFAYRVHAGALLSRAYSVTAVAPPRVQRIDLRYEYPAFTGLAPHDERNGGDVFGPAGTRVRLRVLTDKPVASGRLSMSEGKPAQPLARVDERTFESTLTLTEDGGYRISLADADGLTSDGTEYFIRVMDDRPPEVHLLRPMGDQQITPLEEVTIEARADDDYGIAAFDLVYAVAGGKEKIVPFTTLGGTSIARIGSRLIAAEDLGVKPGDVVSYYARARDVARGKQSTLARSEIFFLEVKPFNEEYSLAQSQAMAAATGTQLESLIAAQKEIISATWNLERRSAAGRSAADIKSIADAQAELKGRAEQASGMMRPRRRSVQPPQQLAAPQGTGANPIADAVTAMARAQQQLEGRRTSEAIPHEMAALTALVKAEAEVRRRQITQQANGSSSGGYGRQGQDLSNLFDRELKRQQRTNYETQSQIEERPDQTSDTSALDRIRELARRQEELNRQQRELAGSELTADELKRELEKLTREQMELRQQAEDLAKRMKQDGAQSSQNGRSSEGSPDMSKATDQMRGAATDLRREDVASAAARGEQAARELRNLERQLQTSSPDARRRALGELQLESQQLAEAQRRVASEAEQLDREGGGTTDARRRLASEKEDLADRVDALREAARRVGADPKGQTSDRATMSEAAKELERQRLSERMRAAARDMRDGAGTGDKSSPAKPMAVTERQLADALDQVARRINGVDAGGAKGETQRLAENLEQVRDARDRLARLEKQIHDKQQASAQPSGQPGATGPQGRQGQNGSQGDGQGSELNRLQQEYGRELQRTRDLVDRLQRGTPDSGRNMSTPEEHEWSRSAPGNEAWKQDYAGWDSLSKGVKQALERYESTAADRLSRALTADRLRGGGSDRVPDAYQRRIARYFESLAKR
jgi:hypothetical protein